MIPPILHGAPFGGRKADAIAFCPDMQRALLVSLAKGYIR